MKQRAYEVAVPGFVSEHGSEPQMGETEEISTPVTGNLKIIRNANTKAWDVTSLQLLDDSTRLLHPIVNVSFLNSVGNPREGKKKFPRPWVYEYPSNDKKQPEKLISMGDKLAIIYVGGSIYNPLIIGAVESLAITNQVQFLGYDPTNLERQPERYENDDYTLEYENDGHGNLKWIMLTYPPDSTKKNQGGTGNIEIDLIGTPGNGKLNLNFNGVVTLNQLDKNGKVIQQYVLDNTDKAQKISLVQQTADGTIVQQILMDDTNGSEQIKMIDKSKNIVTMDKNGTTIVDANNNKLEMSSAGVKINNFYVVLEPMLDWILQNATQFGMGNLGIPVPIMPPLVAQANEGISGKQGFVSNNPGE